MSPGVKAQKRDVYICNRGTMRCQRLSDGRDACRCFQSHKVDSGSSKTTRTRSLVLYDQVYYLVYMLSVHCPALDSTDQS